MAIYAQALKDAGETVVENDMNADVAIIWSVLFQGNMSGNYKVWERFKASGKPVIVLEVGAFIRVVFPLAHDEGPNWFHPDNLEVVNASR